MKVYALKNGAYPESSSGAAFPTIAEEFYKQSGNSLVVYGAAFDDDFSVKHRASKYDDGISCFQESKYVQSSITEPMSEITDLLRRGIPVLFSGTPCQVTAVVSKVQKEGVSTELLLTVDLICHGTPKPELWEKYVRLIQERHGKIKRVCFRNSTSSDKGKTYIELENGETKYDLPEMSTYMRLFSTNKSLYKGCFSCRHRNKELKRPADITIGDFWGVSEVLKEYKGKRNVSLVITNTDKGQKLIDSILERKSKDLMIDECTDEQYKTFNPHLFEQTKIPDDYNSFWTDYNHMTIQQLDKKYGSISVSYRIKKLLSGILSKLGVKYKVKKIIHYLRT